MNHLNGQIAIGAPHSPMRYRYATHICADCLASEPTPQTNYSALSISGKPVILTAQCYVCEQRTSVARVHALGSLNQSMSV